MNLEDRYVELDLQRRDLEQQLLEVIHAMHGDDAKISVMVNGRGGGLEREIMSRWSETGTEQVKARGLTLHLRTETVGAPANGMDELCDAMVVSGYENLVKERREVNWQTLRSFIGEQDTDDDGDPIMPTEELQNAIQVERRVSLRTRKS